MRKIVRPGAQRNTEQQHDFRSVLADRNWGKVKHTIIAKSNVRSAEMRNNLGIVLDNTRAILANGTMTQNLNYLPKLVLPLVSRMFPALIANNIISTQPLQGPSGIIRYMDWFIVDENGNPVEKDSPFGKGNVYPWEAGDTKYSLPPKMAQKWFSGADVTGTTVDTASKVTSTVGTAQDLSKNGCCFVTVGGKLILASEGTLVLKMAKHDAPVVNAGVITTPGYAVAQVTRQGAIQQLNQGVDSVIGFVNEKTGDFTVTIKATSHVADDFWFWWEYKHDVQKKIVDGTEKNMNTGKFNISKQIVEAKTRELGTQYSYETMEDFQAEFGQKFEDKVVDYLTQTILTEIDGECIEKLSNAAVWKTTWDATMPLTWTKGLNDWYATIMPKINQVSNTIFRHTHAQGATFLVCNPTTATIFQGMMQYAGKGDVVGNSVEVGSVNVGTLSNSMKVYVSPLVEDGEILLGFKGSKPEETGAVYAPYIPVTLTPQTYNFGMPALVARSRYWMGVVRPDYYGKITVTGLTDIQADPQYYGTSF